VKDEYLPEVDGERETMAFLENAKTDQDRQ
jgi:hypothetical protein